MSVETGAKSAIPLRCAPNSQPFRNCSSDKSGSFAEAEAYHSFYRKLARRHFNPRTPEGCNTPVYFSLCSMRCFNPRAPCGARPQPTASLPSVTACFNPRALRGARRGASSCHGILGLRFNPRAPRGARLSLRYVRVCYQVVSTHAPREGRDHGAKRCQALPLVSTPARGATRAREACRWIAGFQPTRPARGATPESGRFGVREQVSTHAPREGRDRRRRLDHGARVVSTHAPREGRDRPSRAARARPPCFNPRAPRGARPRRSVRQV